jgi:hypothetical protein
MPLLVTSCEEPLPMSQVRADEALNGNGPFGGLAGNHTLLGGGPLVEAVIPRGRPSVAPTLTRDALGRPASLDPRF